MNERELAPTPSTIHLGLRFDPRDTKLLEAIAERIRQAELPDPEGLFSKAAEAARNGGLMGLICENVEEGHRVAAQFVRYGVQPPTVQEIRS